MKKVTLTAQLRKPRLTPAPMPASPFRGNWRKTMPSNVKQADAILEAAASSTGLKVADGPAALREYYEGKEAVASLTGKGSVMPKLMTWGGIGLAGGATAYGGFKGWKSGQAEVNNSLKQSFDPKTVY
jgi:uncharacterized membrane protein YebE (DUF533 family)